MKITKSQWIRKQPCCIPNCTTGKSIDAAHIRTAQNSGIGTKPGDDYLVPMCIYHHRISQHTQGHAATLEKATGRKWDRFEAKEWFLEQARNYNKRYITENFSL